MPLGQDISDALANLLNGRRTELTYEPIDPRNATYQGAAEKLPSIHPGEDYFRLVLAEMYLKDDKHWLRDVYPVVHSLVTLTYADQQVELPYVAGPGNMQNMTSSNLSTFLSLNHPLTGLLPYRGGKVNLQAGLLAVPGSDTVGSLLKVLGDFAGMLVIPQLSTAIQVASKVSEGLQSIVNPASGTLHVGLQQAFGDGGTSVPFASGYHVAIAAPPGTVDPSKLRVVNGRLQYGPPGTRDPVWGTFDYMLFKIEAISSRSDWASFTTINTQLNAAATALAEKDKVKALAYLESAKLAAVTSPDFSQVDKYRVAEAIGRQYGKMVQTFEIKPVKRVPKPGEKAPKGPKAGPGAVPAPPAAAPIQPEVAVAAVGREKAGGRIRIEPDLLRYVVRGLEASPDLSRSAKLTGRGRAGRSMPKTERGTERIITMARPEVPAFNLEGIMKNALTFEKAAKIVSPRRTP